jgi:anti-anti-sigma regulatory factor
MQKQGDWRRREFSFSVDKPQNTPSIIRFRLGGAITEEAAGSFEAILHEIAGSKRSDVILNMADVAFMNSIGIQGWMGFLKKIDEPYKIMLEECSSEVVTHINLVLGFAQRAEVRSLFAPYTCPKCGKHASVFFLTSQISPEDYPKPPNCECGQVMEMDEPEDEFFAFLER